jgi:hypothetical protein
LSPPSQRRKGRIYFRRLRILLWLMLVTLLGAWIYLNQVGLPGFVKRPLLDKLRARGLELEFSRLRLSWRRGILAENVRFGQANHPWSPRATFGQVQLQLNHRALLRGQFQVDALALRQGRLLWPIPDTNQAPRQLTLEHIQTHLRFLPNDQWALDNFNAAFLGAKVQFSGTLAHASAARDWKFLQPQEPAANWQARLRQLADALERIHFALPPELGLHAFGDARDLHSFSIHLAAGVPADRTPWGTLAQARLNAWLLPGTNHELSQVQFSLAALSAQTRWANLTNFHLLLHLPFLESQTNLINAGLTLKAGAAHTPWASAANLRLEMALAPAQDQSGRLNGGLSLLADRLKSKWGSGSKARLTGRWLQALTNPIPLSAQGRFECGPIETQWGRAAQAEILARASLNPPSMAQAPRLPAARPGPPAQSSPIATHPDRSWWAQLEPYSLDWDCRLADLQAGELAAQQIACTGAWRAPTLTLTNLQAAFTHGQIGLRAALNVATRALEAAVTSDVDPGQLASILPESAAHWAAQVAWNQPPRLSANVQLVLPPWTNRQPDWRAEILPAIRVDGQFQAPEGAACRGVSVSALQSHFSYSNQCWRLPDLRLTRPEGQLLAAYSDDALTKQFCLRVVGSVDPRAARPLLDQGEQGGLDFFTFTQPPVIEIEVRGRRDDAKQLGIRGQVALTNFTFRGESASSLQTGVLYSNQVLQLQGARLLRGSQQLNAGSLIADFNAQKIYVTNGFSTTEPMVVARAIGPPIARAFEPFHFAVPPAVHAQGIIPMHGEEAADLYFQVEAQRFHWLNFTVPQVAANLHWAGLHLLLSGVRLDFYGGKAAGSASFYFDPHHPGTDYQFTLRTSNTLLQSLMADLSTRTNHLAGRLTGTLVITNANSEDWRQTQGRGALELRDGLIFEIPLFGVFSPVLDSLAPGLGSSRASAGTARFVITNGVIHSEDLVIHSPPMRLRYWGTADLQGRLDARAEAHLLRDVPFFGPFVSLAFSPMTKLFEFDVTGSLNQPKTHPRYLLPRIMLVPLHPLRTLKALLPEDPAPARTNTVPSIKP